MGREEDNCASPCGNNPVVIYPLPRLLSSSATSTPSPAKRRLSTTPATPGRGLFVPFTPFGLDTNAQQGFRIFTESSRSISPPSARNPADLRSSAMPLEATNAVSPCAFRIISLESLPHRKSTPLCPSL